MSFEVNVINRQRSVPVDLARVRKMSGQLAAAVFRNLRRLPAGNLPGDLIEQMAERGNLSLTLVSNRRIQALNSQWRGKNAATDVLSFPLELDLPLPGLPWEIGEVVISLERAREQAETYGHSFERELAFLFVHGFLHVLGFDHEKPEDEKEMFGRQRAILNAAGYSRS